MTNKRYDSRYWWMALSIFLLALIARAGMALWMPDEIVWDDGHRYEKVAMNLLAGEGFGSFKDNARSVPTQPVIIAAIYSVFGRDYTILRLFFAGLGALTCVLAFALGTELFGRTVGILAGFLLALYPYYVYLFTLFEYPQPFFVFVMSCFFLLLYLYLDRRRILYILTAGICLGLGILSVPTVLLYVPLLLLWLVVQPIIREQRVKAPFVLLIGIMIPLAPWTIRNSLAYDHFVLVNSAGGFAFWSSNNETYYRHGKKAVVYPCQPPYQDTVFCREKNRVQNELKTEGLGSIERALEKERLYWLKGLSFIKDDPARFLELTVYRFAELWSPFPNPVSKGKGRFEKIRNLIALISYTPVLLLAIGGFVKSIGSWRRLMPIYLYCFTFSMIYSIFLPATRYRLPLDFFLIFFAAYMLFIIWQSKTIRSAIGVRPENR